MVVPRSKLRCVLAILAFLAGGARGASGAVAQAVGPAPRQAAPQRDQAHVFGLASDAPLRDYSIVRDEERIVAVDLRAELPGVTAESLRVPFADAPRRLRVLVAAHAAASVVVAGGVRAGLSLVILGPRGRSSIVLPEARLLAGFEAPLLDATGSVLLLVYRDGTGLQLRAFHLTRPEARILLARRIEGVPDSFVAEALPGDPRVRIRLGKVATRAPGAVAVTEAVGRAPTFFHPLYALPLPDRLHLDHGALEAALPGGPARTCSRRTSARTT
nr:hypothetical protein [Planctomycetota bacterium]